MTNNLEIAIGDKIKSFRKKREITQEQLAQYLNISFQSVSKWECGDAYPDVTMLPKIALFFGVTTDELLCIDKLKEQEEVEEYIRNNINDLQSDIEFIIGFSEGIIGKAVTIATSPELQNTRESVLRLLFNIKVNGDDEIKKLFKENKENIDFLFNVMTLFYRDVLVYKNTHDEKMLINLDKKDMIIGSAKKYSAQYLMNNIDLIEKVKRDIDFNTNYNNTIDFMLVNLQEDLI